MASSPISQSAGRLLNLMGPMIEFFTNSDYSRRVDSGDPSICNFVTGDPQEFPLPGVIEAVTRALVPQSSSWLAYTTSDDAAKADIAARLNRRVGVPFTPGDVCFTPGAFGALFVAMKAVLDPGDEVITVIPNWPFYQWLIIGAGGEPVEVPATRPGWDLDLDAIASAVTGRTRAIIVNTPNNPTGRIYQPETLARLGEMLSESSERIGRTIYLLSDESYSKIVYDGRPFHSPCAHYANSVLIYTYGKVLCAPGLRLGYLALNPAMPSKGAMLGSVIVTQIANGWQFPSSVLQYAAGDLDDQSIDMEQLEAKRDRMVTTLTSFGYDVQPPEGTLFLLVGSPIADSSAFGRRLAEHDIFVISGGDWGFEGYFRVSLTATNDMIDRALPGFKAAIEAGP